MKLYTEEQVRNILDNLQTHVIEKFDFYIDEIIDEITPIELPSDEEIEKKFEPKSTMYELGFRDGAKWVIDKIKNQQ